MSALRSASSFGFGDAYVEYGARNAFDFDLAGFDPATDDPESGWALYANLNLYRGPFALSWEHSNYRNFEVVSRADGLTALNRPPALAREFAWMLLNRAPHTLNAKDERGHNLDLVYNGPRGTTITVGGARIERQDGARVYEVAHAGINRERWRDLRLAGVFGYQEGEGLRQTIAVEVTWFASDARSWTLQAEHQHVRVGGGPGFDLGAYDQEWLKLEYETAPSWAFAAMLERNNKYVAQYGPDETAGPFSAAQVTRTLAAGGSVSLWLGERQAGFLCSGGVCKFEPAFSGVEIFGIFRY